MSPPHKAARSPRSREEFRHTDRESLAESLGRSQLGSLEPGDAPGGQCLIAQPGPGVGPGNGPGPCRRSRTRPRSRSRFRSWPGRWSQWPSRRCELACSRTGRAQHPLRQWGGSSCALDDAKRHGSLPATCPDQFPDRRRARERPATQRSCKSVPESVVVPRLIERGRTARGSTSRVGDMATVLSVVGSGCREGVGVASRCDRAWSWMATGS